MSTSNDKILVSLLNIWRPGLVLLCIHRGSGGRQNFFIVGKGSSLDKQIQWLQVGSCKHDQDQKLFWWTSTKSYCMILPLKWQRYSLLLQAGQVPHKHYRSDICLLHDVISLPSCYSSSCAELAHIEQYVPLPLQHISEVQKLNTEQSWTIALPELDLNSALLAFAYPTANGELTDTLADAILVSRSRCKILD